MKKLLTVLSLITSLFAFSQNENRDLEIPQSTMKKEFTGNFTIREVDKMAILKECKSIDGNNKNQLQLCLTDNLKNRISLRFTEFDKTADNMKLKYATAQIQFVLDKNGKIDGVKMMNVRDAQFSDFVKSIFDEMKETIEFEPAKIEDENVNFVFQLPVKYNRDRE